MQKLLPNTKGFGLIAVLAVVVVLGVIGGGGAYVYHQNHKTKPATKTSTTSKSDGSSSTKPKPVADVYAGWGTYTSAKEGLSFRYPSGWITRADPCVNPATQAVGECIKIDSPVRTGSPYVFELGYYWNSGTNIGPSQVYETQPLTVKGSTSSLYLTAESAGNPNGGVCDLNLVTQNYPIGKDSSVSSVVPSQKQQGVVFALSASMRPSAGAQNTPCYSLSEYKTQPDYQDLLKVFESVQYS
ncbi:hypothetical protein [Streptacidiphilus cavernicola]|uniref:Uncharacterized protein n=1 Tax=Streptacidiphilus cavernicola TaxID=3342716 RepID=A0ABV6W043_9ACTN